MNKKLDQDITLEREPVFEISLQSIQAFDYYHGHKKNFLLSQSERIWLVHLVRLFRVRRLMYMNSLEMIAIRITITPVTFGILSFVIVFYG